jgi:plastocyanin
MSYRSRSGIAARRPMSGLSLVVALMMVFAIACGGEDAPTATPPPAAAPAATSTPVTANPTATIAPAATATNPPVIAATPTSASSYGEYPSAPTAEPSGAATEEPAAELEEVTITIQGFRYQPEEVTISVGSTITWTNMDGPEHSATADDRSFNTGLLGTGESASITFDTPGTYTYFCILHPSMTATVIVRE